MAVMLLYLTALDRGSLHLYINEVIRPDYEQVFPTLGMPFWEDPTKNGMLRIKFNIIFPIHPTADQKAQINKVLSLPS